MHTFRKLTLLSALVFTLGYSSAACAESTGQYVDDATLTTKVKAALIADSELKALRINVQTNQGTVELRGTVNTADDEARAVQAAYNVNGVKQVKDMMVVKGAAPTEN